MELIGGKPLTTKRKAPLSTEPHLMSAGQQPAETAELLENRRQAERPAVVGSSPLKLH